MKARKNNMVVFFCLVVLCVCTSACYFDDIDSWNIDMLSHFPFQYALVAGSLLLVCLWKKYAQLSVLAGLIFVVNIGMIIDFGSLTQAAGYEDSTFKVYSANIHRFNRDMSRLAQEIEEKKPEIVLLCEVTADHIQPLRSIMKNYPYHVEYTPVGKLGIGIVLLSKFPVSGVEKEQLSEFGNALVTSVLKVNGRETMLFAIHSPNPSFKKDFPVRTDQFLRIAEKINKQSMPVIVAGDFNATPYSPTFKHLLKATGLKDSRDGFGWQPSWPTSFPLLWIPIDHILVSPEFKILNRAVGNYIGSDHYPVLAELSMS